MSTFTKVTGMLEAALAEAAPQTQADKQKQANSSSDKMPPMTHTFMDLVITISVYLPRASYPTLFSIASLTILADSDPQLQKKAYKLIPRLAESPVGRSALMERNAELQSLLLSSAEKASPAARRDRLAAIAQVIEFLPKDDLHFIPSILSEVVISAKEVNEKARTAAFDLLVLMGEKMQKGGVVMNRKVAHMPDDAPDVPASLEEYLTMLSAGLAGATPHMISASITALTRILYHFRGMSSPLQWFSRLKQS
jgi:ribosomal RNA-processing protein 12